MPGLKSNRELSFGYLLDHGTSREELMKRFALSEGEYERKLASLKDIRKRTAEKQKAAGR